MQQSQTPIFLLVGAILFSFTACVAPEESTVDSNTLRPNVNTNFNSDAANANANTAKDDEQELDKLVNLPFTPQETVWRTDKVGNVANSNRVPVPTGYVLTAVLKFTEEDADALINQTKDKAPLSETELEAESWFPAELIAKSETSGNSTIKGTVYSAQGFIKSPYSAGRLIRIDDTDYFVLKLHTK